MFFSLNIYYWYYSIIKYYEHSISHFLNQDVYPFFKLYISTIWNCSFKYFHFCILVYSFDCFLCYFSLFYYYMMHLCKIQYMVYFQYIFAYQLPWKTQINNIHIIKKSLPVRCFFCASMNSSTPAGGVICVGSFVLYCRHWRSAVMYNEIEKLQNLFWQALASLFKHDGNQTTLFTAFMHCWTLSFSLV